MLVKAESQVDHAFEVAFDDDDQEHIAFMKLVEKAAHTKDSSDLVQRIAAGHRFCERAVIEIAAFDIEVLCAIARSDHFAKVATTFGESTIKTIADSCFYNYRDKRDITSACVFARVLVDINNNNAFWHVEKNLFDNCLLACKDPNDVPQLFDAFQAFVSPRNYYRMISTDYLAKDIRLAMGRHVVPFTQLKGITGAEMLSYAGLEEYAKVVRSYEVGFSKLHHLDPLITKRRISTKRHRRDEDATCSVCLDEAGDVQYRFFMCKHGLHRQCAMGMLRKSWMDCKDGICCPLCRAKPACSH